MISQKISSMIRLSDRIRPIMPRGEQGDVGEEAAGQPVHVARRGGLAALVVRCLRLAHAHVADGVDEDQEADERHHEEHGRGQRIHAKPNACQVAPGGQPIPEHPEWVLAEASSRTW